VLPWPACQGSRHLGSIKGHRLAPGALFRNPSLSKQHCHCPSRRNRAQPGVATVAISPDEDTVGASHHHHGTRDTVPTLRFPVASPSYPWSAAARTATEPATAAVRCQFWPPLPISHAGKRLLATLFELLFQFRSSPKPLGRRSAGNLAGQAAADPLCAWVSRKKKTR
jgi:hypothetical protein